jgi:hypothetical protein
MELHTKIESEGQEFIVFTGTSFMFFWKRPRTSVMPFRTKNFVVSPGFQLQYNTTDSKILTEWHELLCEQIGSGLFAFLADGTHPASYPLPQSKEHLRRFVSRIL